MRPMRLTFPSWPRSRRHPSHVQPLHMKGPPRLQVRGPLPLPAGPHALAVEPDGTILLPDGSLCALVGVRGFLGLPSLDPYGQERVTRAFGALAHGLAHGQALQVLIESRPLSPAAVLAVVGAQVTTGDPVLRDVATATLSWLETEVARRHVPDLSGFIWVTPPPEKRGGLAGVTQELRSQLGLRSPASGAQARAQALVARHGLDAAVDDALTHLARADLVGSRLRRPETLSLLWRTAHPGLPQPPSFGAVTPAPGVKVSNPTAAVGLAAALQPTWWRETRREVQHEGGVFTRSLYLLGPLEVSSPGSLGDLIALECPYRLSWHLRGLDNDRERARVLRKRKAASSAVRRALERGRLPNLNDEDMATEAAELAQELRGAGGGLVHSTLVLTLEAPSLEALDAATRRALSVIRTRLGVEPGRGRGYQGPLWRASLPLGQNAARRRAKRWHTAVVGNCLPFLGNSPGTPTGLPLGFTARGHELVLLDLIHPSLATSVITVTGAAGSGKTFLLLRLALWTRLRGGRVTLVARADHFAPFVALCGGVYLAPGLQDAPPILNLWDLPQGVTPARQVETVVAAHEILLCNPGAELDPEVRSELDRAIAAVYAACGPGPLLGLAAPRERDLVAELARRAAAPGVTMRKREMLERAHATLLQYVSDPTYGEGRLAYLVDRHTGVDAQADVLCWNLADLSPRLYALTMFTITAAMATRAKSTFDARRGGSAEFLGIDEGWFMSDFMGAAAHLNDWARRSRHMGLILAFASQQLSDLIKPGTKPIFDAASLRCAFRLADVREHEDTAAWAATVLQCTLEEAHTLTGLPQGSMLLITQTKDGLRRRGEVQVLAPPLEYQCFTTETWADVPRRNEAVARLGSVGAAIKELAAAGASAGASTGERREP